MGTNYYWYEWPPCPTCEREYEPRHIGKSSFGWCFSLHVYPEDDITDLSRWTVLWTKRGTHIRDEYGKSVTKGEMLAIVTEREGRHEAADWTPAEYASNSAESGPNGLARHQVDGTHCIGHGAGTWDLIVGEFS